MASLGHPGLGVPGAAAGRHRGAEVALPVDERIAQRPRLDEPDEGVIDRLVAVRVVLTHDVTDDAGALVVPAVRPVAAVEHGVDDPAVDRL